MEITNKKENYIKRILEVVEPGTRILSEYINAKTKLDLECSKGHHRYVTSNDILSGKKSLNCRECAGLTASGKKSVASIQEECAIAGYTLIGEYNGALNPLTIKNNICKHEFTIKMASYITRGRKIECPECSTPRRASKDIVEEIKSHGVSLVTPYVNMKTNIDVTNSSCGHTYTINPGHFIYDNIGTSCTICSGLTNIKNRFFTSLLDNSLELLDPYTTTQTPVLIKNTLCKHVYSVIPNNLVCANTGVTCNICTPTNTSLKEKELVLYIKSIYSGWVLENDRSLISPKELDIVLPDLGLAFEFNGLYWHQETKKGKAYHLNKCMDVNSFDYKLIQINEDEWDKKPLIVKSRIKSLLGVSERIFAKKCIVKEIPFPRQFLIENHIQGAGVISSTNLGLFLDDWLVAVMTFSTPKFSKDYDFELVRYCSILDITVVGGASKLLKYFKIKYPNKTIVSYSDKRWSIGNLYKTLGFKFLHTSPPNYRYYKNDISYSRYQCQRHKLEKLFNKEYSKELSEPEIMKLNGFYRVFDAGNDVWVM